MNEKRGVMLYNHTSMRVGGPAEVFCEPADEAELVSCVNTFRRAGTPYFLLGNGTNVIVRDGGYPGAVVSTLKGLGGIRAGTDETLDGESECAESRLFCGAGESLARVCRYAAELGLSGFEELAGIPGTVGGAVYMNAGAYGRELSELVVSVRAYDADDNNIIMLSCDDCSFGYRTSLFRTNTMIVLSAEFALRRGERGKIDEKMAEYARRRNEKQPVSLPSAGSFFKRPEGDFAGRLIEAAGMKGICVGGAQVSEKHAGFIVNTGGATADDVLALAAEVKKKVFEMFRVKLEEEPVIIGV